MNRHLRILLPILLLVVLSGLTWQVLRRFEPVYQGKPASAWLAQYSRTVGPWSSHGIWPIPTNADWKLENKAAKAAIHQMGANILPVLLRMASAKDSALRWRIGEFVFAHLPQNIAVNLVMVRAWPMPHSILDRQSASDGFKLLGPGAQSAVPGLIRLLHANDKAVAANAAMCLAGIGPAAQQAVPALVAAAKDPDPQLRANAVFALGAIGLSTEPAVDVLIEALNDTHSGVSFYALQSLGIVHARPEVVIPLLTAALAKPQEGPAVYDVAIVGLGRFGPAAQSSVSAILPFLNHEVGFIRSDATNALKQIGIGVATKDPAAGSNTITDPAELRPSLHALEFESIHMIDRQIGWAQNARAIFLNNDWVSKDKAIWRTIDGGKSWKQVLCASPAETGNISAFFRDSKTAWVAVADESTNVAIFRTTDGGGSWSRSQVLQNYIIQDSCLLFIGAGAGWLMLIADHGMNSSPGDLYRTSDSGERWRQVNSTGASSRNWIPEDEETPEFENRRPYLTCGGKIAFHNDSTGWVRGSLASTTPALLFITRNGGLNWQVQRLSLPASLKAGRMEAIGLPRFFQPERNEAILPAVYYPTNNDSEDFRTVIYHTQDGGVSWQPTTPVKFYCICSFISASKGWIWSPTPHASTSTAPVKGTLYRTDDGGISWKLADSGKTLEQYLTRGEDLVQLEFVDAEYGWAVARDGHNVTQLLRTIDGGNTWSAMQTTVQP